MLALLPGGPDTPQWGTLIRQRLTELPFISISLLLVPAWLMGQESDLVDTKDLAGRGAVFETEETAFFGINHCSSVGDFNGDGVSDIAFINLIEEPFEDLRIYLVLGSSRWKGRNLIRPDLPDSIQLTLLDIEATYIGDSKIIDVGDLNRDGYAELAFVLDHYHPIGSHETITGVVFIVHGQPDFGHSGEVAEAIGNQIPGTTIFSTRPGVTGTGFLGSCAVLDINGDQRSDLAIGSILDDDTGVVHVLLETENLGREVDLSGIPEGLSGFTIGTPAPPNVVKDAGDFNGDGLQDLLVAVRRDAVYLFLGRPDPTGHYDLLEMSRSGEGVLRFAIPSRAGGYLFYAEDNQATGVGDLDGDGLSEILLGESYYGVKLPETGGDVEGRAHIIYGSALDAFGPDPLAVLRRTVLEGLGSSFQRDQFGLGVARAGDMNGDGIRDLLIGAQRRSERYDDAGEAYVVYGRRDFGGEVRLTEGFDGIRIPGNTSDGGLGSFLGPAGDFNADGNADVLIGEPHLSSLGNGPTSKVFVIFGTGNGTPPLTVVSIEPRSGFLRGGTRVRISGSGFGTVNQVRFGASVARVIDVTSTEIEVESPPGADLGSVPVTVSSAEATRTAPVPFEYLPDRPEIDLRNPGRWGLRVDGVSEFVIGRKMDFADFDGDGTDDLLIGSDLVRHWVVTVIRGGRDLPETTEAFTPGPGKSLIWKRTDVERTFFDVQVRSVGDVNGDGIADICVAAFTEASYLLFGRSGLPAELDFEEEVAAGRAVRLLFDGMSSKADFAPLGDLTGDGINDFAMGVSLEAVLFIAGREEWPAEIDVLDENDPSTFSRLWEGPGFSARVAPLGDVNGDGDLDVLVSGDQTLLRSSVYLVHGLRSLAAAPAGADIREFVGGGGGVLFEWEGRRSDANIRSHVSGVGDVNGDGLADLLIGDEELTVGASHEGITYLIHGRPDFPVHIVFPFDMSPIETEGVVRISGGGLKQTGRALGPAGDYNGDGHPDFTLASAAIPEPFDPFRMFVVFGGPDLPPVLELGNLGRHGFSMQGIHTYTRIDDSSRTPGDLNADGAPDFAFSEYSGPNFPFNEEGIHSPGSVHVVFGLAPRVPFRRGDANDDGSIDITDAIFTLGYLFLGGFAPPCEDAADMDDRGTLEITDAVYLLNYLFSGGPEPPPPHAAAGEDPTEDALGCRGF